MAYSEAEIGDLKRRLREADRSGDCEWLQSLESRKQVESRFHDQKTEHELAHESGEKSERANAKWYATVSASRRYVDDWIARRAPGKIFLDFGCGQGRTAIRAAHAGAALSIGLDISRESIERGRRNAAAAGVSAKTSFLTADCESTGLPDSVVDVVLCSGMLHHLDLDRALPELRRLLRPGGVCLAVEALNYNPLIRLYRRLTPNLRTKWEAEHILSLKELRVARRFFSVRDVRFWHFASIMTAPLRNTRLFASALALANFLDNGLLRIPPFSYLAWQFTFELHRGPSSPSRS